MVILPLGVGLTPTVITVDPTEELADAIITLTARRDNELQDVFGTHIYRDIGPVEAGIRGNAIKAKWRADIAEACATHFASIKTLIEEAQRDRAELYKLKNPAPLMPWEK